MKSLHNIEKSGFRNGYVGYACATVWRIAKNGRKWHASAVRPAPGCFTWCESDTLTGISEKLAAYHDAWVMNGKRGL